MNNNTASQTEAIYSDASKILALAGPGSGKTHTVIQRILRIVNDERNAGVVSNGIVCITFTNAAAKEIQKRLDLYAKDIRLGYLGTLHGFCLQQLQKYGRHLGYGSKINVLDEEQADELLLTTAKDIGCKASLKTLKAARERSGSVPFPRNPEQIVVASYLKQLKVSSAVDFESILDDFIALIETEKLIWRSHLIVDEFQDSGAKDFRIYNMLPARNVFVVGDPDQSIYSFRGGRLANILALAHDPAWKLIKLEGNFRCSLSVCNAANRLIEHNVDRIKKSTFPMADEIGTVEVMKFATDIDEQNELLHDIRGLIKDGQNPNEIAVLARTNAIVSECAKNAEAMGIPVRKKKVADVPQDWALTRAAIELLNDPLSLVAQRQWLRLKYGKERAKAIERRAAIEQTIDYTALIDPISRGCTAANIGQALARLGISRESIALVEEKRDAILDPDLTLLSFAIARDLETETEIGDGVTFTTIHSSKGREWETVFIVGFEQEILPGESKSRNVEEERRLAFVGITRAKSVLVLSHTRSRRASYGKHRFQPATVSQFIAEAGL